MTEALTRRSVFIIDIDTTIADNTHREAHLDHECVVCLASRGFEPQGSCDNCGAEDTRIPQVSWDTFLLPDLVKLDQPVPAAQQAIKRMRELGVEFHFLTGRNHALRPVTEEWLSDHFGWQPERESLVMRTEEYSNIAASAYKEQALKGLIALRDLHDAALVFMEDDPYVFKVYQKYGIVLECPGAWDYFCPPANTGVEPKWRK